ncbi:DUF898 family protein [Pararhodospirillum oryzae]|uniref:Peptidase M48 domain-containing protein n=1 Tax=Pararhodospirillum oryzae TaxID=478448 RepID=A0A512H6Z1_9PROT|nr:DUF898 family protein [Pararhodospirillum oryzae]GEO81226.1 hypothetical protein ROR02_13570 [Pararhodospirillum oryzae]
MIGQAPGPASGALSPGGTLPVRVPRRIPSLPLLESALVAVATLGLGARRARERAARSLLAATTVGGLPLDGPLPEASSHRTARTLARTGLATLGLIPPRLARETTTPGPGGRPLHHAVLRVATALLACLSGGLLLPLATRAAERHRLERLRPPGLRGMEAWPLAPFYGALLPALALALAVGLLGLGLGWAGARVGASLWGPPVPTFPEYAWIAALPALLVGQVAYQGRCRVLALGFLVGPGGERLACTLSGPRLAWIAASNALAVLASAGLLLGWAQARLWRAVAGRLAVSLPAGPSPPPSSRSRRATPSSPARLALAGGGLLAALALIPAGVGETWRLVPRAVDRALGAGLFEALRAGGLAPSGLPRARQEALHARFAGLARADGQDPPPPLALVRAPAPLALALPGGPVLISDRLVRLANDDTALAGVMAHELGHIQARHGPRRLLHSLGLAAGLFLARGSPWVLPAEALIVPVFLQDRARSRAFEASADTHALALLGRVGLDPAPLRALLDRLGGGGGWLDAHPAARNRLRP